MNIINLNRKEVVTKISFTINLESEEEVEAFQAILNYANTESARLYTGLQKDISLQRNIISKIEKAITI